MYKEFTTPDGEQKFGEQLELLFFEGQVYKVIKHASETYLVIEEIINDDFGERVKGSLVVFRIIGGKRTPSVVRGIPLTFYPSELSPKVPLNTVEEVLDLLK